MGVYSVFLCVLQSLSSVDETAGHWGETIAFGIGQPVCVLALLPEPHLCNGDETSSEGHLEVNVKRSWKALSTGGHTE